jgi:hypothetical protein
MKPLRAFSVIGVEIGEEQVKTVNLAAFAREDGA